MRVALSIILLCITGVLALKLKGRNPLAAIATLAGGLLVGLPLVFFFSRPALPPTIEERTRPEAAVVHMLGKTIQEQHPSGGTVLVLQEEYPDPEPYLQALSETRLQALRDVLGPDFQVESVNVTGTGGPETDPATGMPARTTADYRGLIEGRPQPVAIVCVSGLPLDFENLPALGAPVFAYVEDVLPPEWSRGLPPGMSALVTVNPDGYGTPIPDNAELKEIFTSWYILTRSNL